MGYAILVGAIIVAVVDVLLITRKPYREDEVHTVPLCETCRRRKRCRSRPITINGITYCNDYLVR